MTRPKGIEITTWLMVLSLILGLVYLAIIWNSVSGIHLKLGSKATVESVRNFRNFALLIFHGISIAVLFFYWKGRDWARILVLITCASTLYSLLKLRLYWQTSHFVAIEVILNAMLAIGLLWYLFKPDVRAWFTEQTAAAHKPLPA
jgi:hypothetical protein